MDELSAKVIEGPILRSTTSSIVIKLSVAGTGVRGAGSVRCVCDRQNERVSMSERKKTNE